MLMLKYKLKKSRKKINYDYSSWNKNKILNKDMVRELEKNNTHIKSI